MKPEWKSLLILLSLVTCIFCFIVTVVIDIPGFMGYCFGFLSGLISGLLILIIRESNTR